MFLSVLSQDIINFRPKLVLVAETALVLFLGSFESFKFVLSLVSLVKCF